MGTAHFFVPSSMWGWAHMHQVKSNQQSSNFSWKLGRCFFIFVFIWVLFGFFDTFGFLVFQTASSGHRTRYLFRLGRGSTSNDWRECHETFFLVASASELFRLEDTGVENRHNFWLCVESIGVGRICSCAVSAPALKVNTPPACLNLHPQGRTGGSTENPFFPSRMLSRSNQKLSIFHSNLF